MRLAEGGGGCLSAEGGGGSAEGEGGSVGVGGRSVVVVVGAVEGEGTSSTSSRPASPRAEVKLTASCKVAYMGTSLIRKCSPLGPYSGLEPMVLRRS